MIHPKAIIDKETVLGDRVSVGAYAVVEKKVTLCNGVTVSPFVHIKENVFVGEDTFIGNGAVIGTAPQILGIKENKGKIHIGRSNIIREYVTIHSSANPDKETSLGDNNFLMSFSHIAHDCKLGNNVVICNGTLLAGHVQVSDGAFISGNSAIHQFVKIGRLAMVGGLSRVNQDVPPFMMAIGNSRVWGVNLVGLKRASFSKEDINQVRRAFKYIYRMKLPIKNALAELEKAESKVIKEIIVFILSSERGICGTKKNTLMEKIFLDYPYFLRTAIPTYNIFLKARRKRTAEV